MKIVTGNASHDANCAAAETARQTAVAAATTQSAVNSAEVTFYKALRDSAKANGLTADLGSFNVVIRQLNGVP